MDDPGCYNEAASSQDGSSIDDHICAGTPSTSTSNPLGTGGQHNQLGTVYLHGVPIVSLYIDGRERLCLAQISNTLLKTYSYNEIHNRRVALGITCVQCTPVQLELLRRAGAMPVSSRRCGMITRREAERLVKSFLDEITPPKLPDNFAFELRHKCGWGCRGSFLPARYNSSRAKCIRCFYCHAYFSPNKFIFHCHRPEETGETEAEYRHPDAANFNAWRRHLFLGETNPSEELGYAWEDVKAMFNGGNRKRILSHTGGAGGGSRDDSGAALSDDGCRGDESCSPPAPKRVAPTPGHHRSLPRTTASADVKLPSIKYTGGARPTAWLPTGGCTPDNNSSNLIVKAMGTVTPNQAFDHNLAATATIENWVPDLLGLKPTWQLLWSRHLALLQQQQKVASHQTTSPSPPPALNFFPAAGPGALFPSHPPVLACYPGAPVPVSTTYLPPPPPPTSAHVAGLQFHSAAAALMAFEGHHQQHHQHHHPHHAAITAGPLPNKMKHELPSPSNSVGKPERTSSKSPPDSGFVKTNYSIESLIKEQTESV